MHIAVCRFSTNLTVLMQSLMPTLLPSIESKINAKSKMYPLLCKESKKSQIQRKEMQQQSFAQVAILQVGPLE